MSLKTESEYLEASFEKIEQLEKENRELKKRIQELEEKNKDEFVGVPKVQEWYVPSPSTCNCADYGEICDENTNMHYYYT